ncbi:MAG: methionine--tRNA ligase [Alphaproteobacteria bacterium]|nr:methionine--tRNA ligase [Rickettsiales bacterium]
MPKITQNQSNTLYITTPIFYVNDKPHIGHAYTNVIADCIGRLHALQGWEARMQTGTDEHGQKVLKSAEKKGENPMIFCNKISEQFYQLAVDMNCFCSYPKFNTAEYFNIPVLTKALLNIQKNKQSVQGGEVNKEETVFFDKTRETFTDSQLFGNGQNFIRTTEGRECQTGEISKKSLANGRHVKAVIHIWNKLVENGWIYKGNYTGWYSVRDEAFYSESELVDGKAPTGADVTQKSEEAYFFSLSKFQILLLDIYRNNNIIKPHNRFTEVISFLSGISFTAGLKGDVKKGHLQDLCVSRINMQWGIPVPNDKDHVIYVWIDALVNYLSAIHYPSNFTKEFWSKSKTVHVIGKDIIRFHCVYWPALLIAEAITVNEFDTKYRSSEVTQQDKSEFISRCSQLLPKEIFAHGWWTNKGEKISKSLGNTISPKEEIEHIMKNYNIEERFATDYLRFSLLQFMPLGNDGDYNRKQCWKTIDSVLCGNIGNLINRTFSILKKNCDLSTFFNSVSSLEAEEREFLLQTHLNLSNGTIKNLFLEYNDMVQNYKIFEIIKVAIQIADRCNSYIEAVAPWKVAKTNNKRLTSIMQVLYLQIVLVMQLLRFVMPNFVDRFFDYIGLDYRCREVLHSYRKETTDNKMHDKNKEQDEQKILAKLLLLYKPDDNTMLTFLSNLQIFFQKSVE